VWVAFSALECVPYHTDKTRKQKLPSGTFGTGLILIGLLTRAIFWEIRAMTPEERERLNDLRKRIEDEQNPKVFNGLQEELNELPGGRPEPPAECKKPVQIHRD
jgi:hypothetical protein